MSFQLVVIAGPDKGRNFDVPDGQPLLVGRGSASHTKLNDPYCSKIHCRAEIIGEDLYLTDEQSTGGTQVNRIPIRRHRITPGDIISIGETQIEVRVKASPITGKSTYATRKSADLLGHTVAHFVLDEVLSEGKTSFVYKARDAHNGQTVALKILNPQLTQTEEQIQRFSWAMRVMLPLKHRHLVQFFGAGKAGDHCWISMDYVQGESMAQVIRRIGTSGMLDWRFGMRVAVHVARGLQYAQKHQILHRNITPDNVLIRTVDKVVKLGDMMLAKALEGSQPSDLTEGDLLDQLHYASPERTFGIDVDGRSDIYSLGATVYALMTGRPPVHGGGSHKQLIDNIRTEQPESPKRYQLSIPDEIERVVLKMLAKNPMERYQSATELLDDLNHIVQGKGITFE